MSKKIKLAVLFGGASVEHKISLLSAKNVIAYLDRDQYELVFIGISPEGRWARYDESSFLEHADDAENICLGTPIGPADLSEVEVAFPVLHGTLGEDGAVQGYLQVLGIPFVGADVLGSAIGMDKDVSKRLASAAGIATPLHAVIYQAIETCPFVGPCFIKPAKSGSSIGISRVVSHEEFVKGVEEAFLYDDKVLIEEAVEGVELQLGVVGNENPLVSVPCQITPKGALHTYASKYLDPKGALWEIPAPISAEKQKEAQEMALRVYQILCCRGMARVDLFLTREGQLLFNEINTIPGLTSQSPFARMWEASGIPFKEVLARLVALALGVSAPRLHLPQPIV